MKLQPLVLFLALSAAQATQAANSHTHTNARAYTSMQASTKPESGEQQLASIVLRSSHAHNDPHASALTGLHSCWLALTCHPRCVGSAVFVVFMLLWNLFLFVVCSACSSAAVAVA